MTNQFNSVFITDEGYLMPTVTAITSLVENLASADGSHIYLVAIDLGDKSQAILEQLSDGIPSLSIIYKQSISVFEGMANSSHVSTTALFKFLLPEILSDLDQVLYLDGDILINKDLSTYFSEVNLGDHYVAAVKDINVMRRKKPSPLERLGAKHQVYFNSGVMLLNLKKMRENGITSKLIDFKKNKKSTYMDQDAFNYCFDGNVLFLSPKLNYLTFGFYNKSSVELSEFYQEPDFLNHQLMYDSTYIFHFASRWKPWDFWLYRYTALFKKYYTKTPYKNENLHLNYISQTKFFLLYGLKLLFPHCMHKAFEPSSRKVSLIESIGNSVIELIKAMMPTFIYLLLARKKHKRKGLNS